ncbi:MAG: DUF2795 domain-containing protein [Methanosarcina sp.]
MGKVKRYDVKCQYDADVTGHAVSNEKRTNYRALKKQNASSDIMESLKMIPDREYESADSLMKALESTSQMAGGGGKSQSFGGSGHGDTGGGGPSTGGSSQGFRGRGGT